MKPTVENAKLLATLLGFIEKQSSKVKDDLFEQINAIVIPEIPKVVHGKDGLSGRGIADAKLLEGKLVLQYTDGSLDELGNLIGEQGPVGPAGPQGSIGLQGEKGNPGEQGIPGNRGPKGEKGDKGDKGDRGEVGEQGIQGNQGEVGPQGEKGDRGEVGPQGPAGLDGRDGVDGKDGADGKDGRDGVDGKQGEQGPIGLTGPQGVAGPQGERGEKGDKGDKGDSGSDADVTALEKKLNEFTQNVDKRISKVAFNAAVGGGSSAGSGEVLLYRLDDVDYNSVKTPTDGHALVWNNTLGKWQANSVSGGGGLTNTFTTTVATQTLIPTANVTYNLGSSTARYNDIWLANSTIYLGDAEISASGSKVLFNNNPAVSNAHLSATYLTNTAFQSALANTNSYIASESARIDLINTNLTGTNTAIRVLVTTESARIDLINTNLTGTNTAIRTLVSDRMQVANVTSAYVTNSVFQSALANTNAYIATKLDSSSYTEADVRSKAALANTNAYIASVSSTERASLANTNAYIASVQSDVDANEATERAALANTNAYIAATAATERSSLANTNSYIASVQSDVDANEATERAALANTNAYIASVSSTERSALANTNAYIATKADIASPTFTGTPAAPTAAAGTNTTQLATTAFVRTEVTNLVDSAPATLDTLNELAAALGDDPNFATTLTTNLGQKLGATASVALTGDVTGSASFSSNAVSISTTDTNLGNTNSYIASVAATERSSLANTNAYIASVQSDVDANEATERAALANTNSAISNLNTNLTSTNTAIRGLVSTQTSRIDLVNSNLTSTNTALRTLISDRLQVANAVATYQTKAVERAALANTNAYIATKVNTSNPTITGTVSANGSVGTAGYVLKSAGAGNPAYWDAESGGGGVSVATFNSALANTNTYIATKLDSSSYTASDVLTKIKTVDGAGSGLDADTLDGISSASFLRSDASDSFTSGTLTVGGTALDVNVDTTAAGNITMDGSSKLLTLNDNSLDEFTEYARPLANSSTAVTLDVSDNTQLYTLTGNCTFTLPALSNYPSNSSKSITLVVKQDATGSRTVAFSAADGFSINNSATVPQPSTAASSVSIYTCIGIVELAEWFISLSYIDD